MRDRHETALRSAADDYRRARVAFKAARDALVAAIKAAYADDPSRGAQTEILAAIDHVWVREYVRTVLGLTQKRRNR